MILLAALLAARSPAEAYFPLMEGAKWTYKSEAGGLAATQIDVAGKPVEVGGSPATPIVTTVNGRTVGTSYYRVEGDTVFLVAEDPKKPLADPQPVLRVSEGKATWTFSGPTSLMGAAASLDLKGESFHRGERTVLDAKRTVLDVKLEMRISTNEALNIVGKQLSTYAKGVGLIELHSEQTVGKTKSKSSLRLVKFEPPAHL